MERQNSVHKYSLSISFKILLFPPNKCDHYFIYKPTPVMSIEEPVKTRANLTTVPSIASHICAETVVLSLMVVYVT